MKENDQYALKIIVDHKYNYHAYISTEVDLTIVTDVTLKGCL